MLYKRILDPSFWSSTTYCQAKSLVKPVLFLGLMSMGDDQGRLKDIARAIWAQIFASSEAVECQAMSVTLTDELLKELHEDKNILRYERKGECYIQLIKFGCYQPLTRPRPSKMPPPEGWVDSVPWAGATQEEIDEHYRLAQKQGFSALEAADDEGEPEAPAAPPAKRAPAPAAPPERVLPPKSGKPGATRGKGGK